MTDAFQPKSDFLRVMQERGYVHQCSDLQGLDDQARSGDLVAYIGFDCTAPSLHVGSLVQIMMLHWLQETGGKPVALMGGGTTRVGDPSGKDESRKLLTVEEIEANKAGIRRAFAHFIRFGEGKTDAIMPDNAEWLAKLNYIDFLREVGRHFSVNRMLAMDSVKLRLEREHELSFLEFNYMCLQAYDFTELYRRHGVTLQMGGSDQWGNIVTGLDLGRRMGLPQFYALTSPLITTAAGAKMGKTAAGAVWLDASMLSPYDYWQFWRNTEDCRRRPLPAPLHPTAARRNRAGSKRSRAPRSTKPRRRSPTRRPRCCMAARGRRRPRRRRRARPSRRARSPRACRRSTCRAPSSTPASARSPPSSAPASSPRPARRAGRSAAGASGSTTRRSATRRRVIARDALRTGGVVKLSLGRKKHVLLQGGVGSCRARSATAPVAL